MIQQATGLGVDMNRKRYKMKNRNSKRTFKRGTGIHKMNLRPRPMRGGTRL